MMSKNPQNRDKKGRFVKGCRANPGGRPKLPAEFKELAKSKSMVGLQRVAAILEDPRSDPKDVIAAARLIIEYGYGKPTQDVSASLSFGEDFVLEIGGEPAARGGDADADDTA